MAQPARMQDDVSGPEPLRSRAPACDRAGRSDGSPRAPRQSTRARRGSDRGRRRMDTDRPTPGRGASSPASCERPPRRPPSRSPWQTLQRPDRVRRGRARHDGTADGTTARRMHAGRVPAAASTPRRKRAGHQMVTESRFRSFSQAKARRPGGRFAARMPVNAGRARLTELGVIGPSGSSQRGGSIEVQASRARCSASSMRPPLDRAAGLVSRWPRGGTASRPTKSAPRVPQTRPAAGPALILGNHDVDDFPKRPSRGGTLSCGRRPEERRLVAPPEGANDVPTRRRCRARTWWDS